MDIAGADAAYSIGFVWREDSSGFVVARDSERVVIVRVDTHFGEATSEGVTSLDVAVRALARARQSEPRSTPSTLLRTTTTVESATTLVTAPTSTTRQPPPLVSVPPLSS